MARVRTQVYLEREQHQWLRKEAQEMDVSMTELLRRILADYARERRLSPPREAFASITNLGDSGADDVAEQHDRYLMEIIADEHLR
jgi:hypothetical protein